MRPVMRLRRLGAIACTWWRVTATRRVYIEARCAGLQRLREAMDNNRFAIYGQVIKPLDETRIEPERFEILLRLRDPSTRKLIPPGAFLPAAERYGLSLELDEWVVRSLLDALFIHQSFHAEYRRYWINLSGTSIGDPRFAKFLKKVIEHSPLPPGTINFEITERAVIRNVSEAGRLMSELRDMGCQFRTGRLRQRRLLFRVSEEVAR